jgi:hypothetical protein
MVMFLPLKVYQVIKRLVLFILLEQLLSKIPKCILFHPALPALCLYSREQVVLYLTNGFILHYSYP